MGVVEEETVALDLLEYSTGATTLLLCTDSGRNLVLEILAGGRSTLEFLIER